MNPETDNQIAADRDVDSRYASMRSRFGGTNPQANGYRSVAFFRREQRVLMRAIGTRQEPVCDIGCGSGLMLLPLARSGCCVIGLDFNSAACHAAKANGLATVRGDAFRLPFQDGSIGEIVNCQFLNQQTPEHAAAMVSECARVLKRGGRLFILWRHARSAIHLIAHFAFSTIDRVLGRPQFPQFTHSLASVRACGRRAGFVVAREAVTLPGLGPDCISARNPLSLLVGASLFIELRKP